MLYCLDSCASVSVSLTTACCSLTASVRQTIVIDLSRVSSGLVSLIDLNLVSPQQSNLGSSHRVNHGDSFNVLLASN